MTLLKSPSATCVAFPRTAHKARRRAKAASCAAPNGVSIRKPSRWAARALLALAKPSRTRPPAVPPTTTSSDELPKPPTTLPPYLLLTALASAASILSCSAPESAPSPQQRGSGDGVVAIVTTVVDGDTIVVAVGDVEHTVRLLGIDTPEKQGGPRPAECFGEQATEHAKELLPSGASVTLTRDEQTRDQYGRLLAYVHRSDGLFVNRAMVEGGFATPLFFAPNTAMRDEFQTAADSARRDWLGFWAHCGAADVVLPAR